MPVPPRISASLEAIRHAMTSPAVEKDRLRALFASIQSLFTNGTSILSDLDALRAVLAFAPEVDTMKGKGAQSAHREFSRGLGYLAMLALQKPSSHPAAAETEATAPAANEAITAIEMLAAHHFQRVQGPPARSQHAEQLKIDSWWALGELAGRLRRPEHLTHAHHVATNQRASSDERRAAIEFIATYWGADQPDEATVQLLQELEHNPTDRTFLVGLLQTQIELGLNSELGALHAVDAWDDAHEDR